MNINLQLIEYFYTTEKQQLLFDFLTKVDDFFNKSIYFKKPNL